ncbi:hypothetical protein [Shewanella sp. 0m-4]
MVQASQSNARLPTIFPYCPVSTAQHYSLPCLLYLGFFTQASLLGHRYTGINSVASLSEQLYLNSFTLAPLRNSKSLILWGDE